MVTLKDGMYAPGPVNQWEDVENGEREKERKKEGKRKGRQKQVRVKLEKLKQPRESAGSTLTFKCTVRSGGQRPRSSPGGTCLIKQKCRLR